MKAVIPAAGLGTRFLPATKAQPKEMLPVVDKPAIQYVVEEAVASGIEDILIITGRGKRAIEDHFDKNIELERYLVERGKADRLDELHAIGDLARIFYVRQKEPLGLGHAVLCAEEYVGDEMFAVLLGDDILISEIPCTRQLIETSDKVDASVIAVEKVPKERMVQYGMVLGEEIEDGLFRMRDMIEKPSLDEVRSDLGTLGRYVLSPDVFPILKRIGPGVGGEIQLTDAIRVLLKKQDVYAKLFRGKRFDIGNMVDWMKATIEIALMRPEYEKELRDHLKKMLEKTR